MSERKEFYTIECQRYTIDGRLLTDWQPYGYGRYTEEVARRMLSAHRSTEESMQRLYPLANCPQKFRLVKVTREVVLE